MLVIRIQTTSDTNDFEKVYANLDATVLINPSKFEAKHAIVAEKDTIILIGVIK